jgi:hypothetical protein
MTRLKIFKKVAMSTAGVNDPRMRLLQEPSTQNFFPCLKGNDKEFGGDQCKDSNDNTEVEQ